MQQIGDIRPDQYGIQNKGGIGGSIIKFETVLEWRIALLTHGAKDEVCGITSLCPLDLATSKLPTNADRWRDDGVFSRDIINLAMIDRRLRILREAVIKAEKLYENPYFTHLENRLTTCKTAITAG